MIYSTIAPRGTASSVIGIWGQSNVLGVAGDVKAVEGRLILDGVELASYDATIGSEGLLAPNRTVIKRGVGGTSLAQWQSTYFPLALADVTTHTAGSMDALVWVQGERDARSDGGYATYAVDCGASFDTVAAATGCGLFILLYLSGLPSLDYPEMAAMNAQFDAMVAARSDTIVLPTAGYEKQGDNIHYTRAGQDSIAKAVRAALVARGL